LKLNKKQMLVTYAPHIIEMKHIICFFSKRQIGFLRKLLDELYKGWKTFTSIFLKQFYTFKQHQEDMWDVTNNLKKLWGNFEIDFMILSTASQSLSIIVGRRLTILFKDYRLKLGLICIVQTRWKSLDFKENMSSNGD
jgi:hypothetical protein